MDLQSAGVAAGGIRAQFHPDPALLGYFFSASSLGLLIGATVAGRLADRFGRKLLMTGSVAAFGLFSLLTPFAWDADSLIAARLLTGLGLGGALPNLIALTSESAPANRRSAYVTMIYAGAPLGGALVSLVNLLIAAEQWRLIFIAGGVLPLLLTPVLLALLTESPAFLRERADAARAGSGQLKEIVTGGRARNSVLLWISFLLALLILYLLLNWLPTLMLGSGMLKSQAAAAQILFNVGGTLGAIYVGWQLESHLRRAGVLAVFAGLPCALALLIAVIGNVNLTYCVIFGLGGAVIAAQAILYAFAPLCYPTRIRGTGVGVAVSVGRFGSIIGPLLGAVLFSPGRPPAQVLLELLPVVAAGSGCALVLLWQAPKVEPDSAAC